MKQRQHSQAAERRRHKEAAREITCRACGALFCPLFGCSSGVASCSDQCRADLRTANNRRKAMAYKVRRNGATVERFDPIEVLERDGWRCQICDCDTPRELRGTSAPNAPELDHIVALSAGGAHARWNTQCACRTCNMDKSDGPPRGRLELLSTPDARKTSNRSQEDAGYRSP